MIMICDTIYHHLKTQLFRLVSCLDMTLMETLMGHLHHLNASPFIFWMTRYIWCKLVAFITRHMTFAENQTQSILPPALISWLERHPTNLMKAVICFGMLGSSASIMPRFILHILKFGMEDKFTV